MIGNNRWYAEPLVLPGKDSGSKTLFFAARRQWRPGPPTLLVLPLPPHVNALSVEIPQDIPTVRLQIEPTRFKPGWVKWCIRRYTGGSHGTIPGTFLVLPGDYPLDLYSAGVVKLLNSLPRAFLKEIGL